MTKENPSIEFLKLFALAAGLLTWETEAELINTRVIVFCNNQAVIHMVNDMTSSCEKCMKLIRLMVLSGLRCNRRVTAKFVPSKSNGLTDALSRGQWKRFCVLGPHMDATCNQINPDIWPIQKIWN